MLERAEVNLKNYHRETLLHQALLYNESLDCIKVLLDYGAEVTEVGKRGRTISHHVAVNSEIAIVKYAIGLPTWHSIEALRDNEGYLAIQHVDCECLVEFLKWGADVNILVDDDSVIDQWYCAETHEKDKSPAFQYVRKLYYLGLEVKNTNMWKINQPDDIRNLCDREVEQLKSKIICWNPKERYTTCFL